ncbi:unnamed protein product [Lactuca virosa]|uniref:Uncharacterized protein n=1 Tax=Lactuca virosa TaxID=75947 RepID=A0AAU9MGY1_9ASTR|nr:unnamed protein product [Lactuca virosa]
MHEPITALFSSQSTEAERLIHEEEPNDDEITNRFRSLVESIEQKQVKRLAVHSKNFEYEIRKLCDVAKENHDIFVKQVTQMKESVDLKVAEIKSDMSKEVEKIEKNYTLLHSKVDVVATAITKLFDFNTEYSNKLEVMLEKYSQISH